MDDDLMYGIAAVVVALFAGLIVLVPVLALTLRFALRPVLETWARVRQGQSSDQQQALLDRRMNLLESELQQVQHTLQSLAEAQEFQRRLAEPAPPPSASRLSVEGRATQP